MANNQQVSTHVETVTERFKPIEKSLMSKFNSRRIDKDIQFKIECQFLQRRINKSEYLARATTESLANTLIEAGAIGLSLNPSLSHAYPIPYKNSITKEVECELSVGYLGMEYIVYKAGTIKLIQTELVKASDPVFERWTDANGAQFKHVISRGNRGQVTHAYCLARYMNGGHHLEVMDINEILSCEKAAKVRPGGGAAWDGDFREEMMKKCVVRRAYKHWPKDDGGVMQALMENMNRVEPMDFSSFDASEDGLTINEDQKLQLHATLTDHGLDPKKASRWLEKIALQNGLTDIINLPASKFSDIKDNLTKLVKDYMEGQQSGSAQ